MPRTPVILVLTLCMAAALAELSTAANWMPVATTGSSVLVEEDTRLRDLDPIFHQLFLPDQDEDVKLTSILQLFPIDPPSLGARKVKKARAKVTASCFTPSGQRQLGSKTVRANVNGGMVFTDEAAATLDCDLFLVEWDLQKKTVVPQGTSIVANTAAELVAPGADEDCFDPTTLCLNDDRFRVAIDWRDFQNQSGSGIGFPRSDDSGLLYFFDPDNWEFLVKVLDGCSQNDHFWVFYGATTHVEYDLTVTDTLTGQSRVYSDAPGSLGPILDTRAFDACR